MVDHKFCEYLLSPFLTFHICCDAYNIYFNYVTNVCGCFLRGANIPIRVIIRLIDIGLRMDCEYMLEYQGLIESFVSSYVVLLPLLY